MKKIIILLFFIIIFEVCSFFFVQSLKGEDEFYFKDFDKNINLILKHKETINKYYLSDDYSSLLGWDYSRTDKRINQYQARKDSLQNFNKIKILTYGSSFTWGDGVNNEQTWQHYLSKKINAYVVNYGVGGYSIFQAYLKFKKHKKFYEGSSKIVVLTIFESEIDRIRNQYLNFYFNSGFRIRPVPLLVENKLVSNNLPEFSNNENVINKLIKHLNKNKDNDQWWNRRIDKAFPFSLNLIKLLNLKLQDQFEISLLNSDNKNSWNNNENLYLLELIISEFVHLSEKRNLKPVIMFLPRIRNKLSSGYKYKEFIKKLRDKNHKILNFAEFVNLNNLKNNPITTLSDGHYTAYTNEKIAEFVYDNLINNN